MGNSSAVFGDVMGVQEPRSDLDIEDAYSLSVFLSFCLSVFLSFCLSVLARHSSSFVHLNLSLFIGGVLVLLESFSWGPIY